MEVKGSDTGRSTAEVVKDAAGPMLLGVIKGTIPLTVISFAVGLVIALVAALARMSANPLLRGAGAVLHLGHPRDAAAGAAVHHLLRPAADRASSSPASSPPASR